MSPKPLSDPPQANKLFKVCAGIAAIILLAILLRWMVLSPNLSLTWKMTGVLLVALIFLVAGSAGIVWTIRRLDRRNRLLSFRPWLVLASAYLLPVLLIAFPYFFTLQILPWRVDILAPGPQYFITSLWRPWFVFWQALILGIAGLGSQIRRVPLFSRGWPAQFPWTLLTGFGLALSCAFIVSLSGWVTPMSQSAIPPGWYWAILAVSVTALPWSEEVFFRGYLPYLWPAGGILARLGFALVFSLAQLRPALIIPAFLAALVLDELTRRTKNLAPAVFAHVLVNLLLFFINWSLVI
jgi:membrane protease YdiL (CAAX protease family)